MSSEVIIGITVFPAGEAKAVRQALRHLAPEPRPGAVQEIIEDYSTEPPSQLLITNTGRTALIARTEIAPADRLPVSRNLVQELDANDPKTKLNIQNAMGWTALVAIRFIPRAQQR